MEVVFRPAVTFPPSPGKKCGGHGGASGARIEEAALFFSALPFDSLITTMAGWFLTIALFIRVQMFQQRKSPRKYIGTKRRHLARDDMDEDFSCLFDATELDREALDKSRKVSFSARGNLTPPCTRERHKTQTRTRPRKKRDRKRRSQVFWRRKREREKQQTRRRLLQKRIQEKSGGGKLFSVRAAVGLKLRLPARRFSLLEAEAVLFSPLFPKKKSGKRELSRLLSGKKMRSEKPSLLWVARSRKMQQIPPPPSLHGEKQSRKEPLLGDTHT